MHKKNIHSPVGEWIFLCSLLKEESSEKKNPNKVKPTENETTTNGSDDSHYKADDVTGLEEGAPSNNNLSNPVNNGNDEKKKLNKTALLIKPSHRYNLLIKIVFSFYHKISYLYITFYFINNLFTITSISLPLRLQNALPCQFSKKTHRLTIQLECSTIKERNN